MGRRKSKRKPPPKKKMTGNLDVQFTCPFCNHEKSCDVKMERTRNTGIISCSVCLEEFQTPITCILLTNKRLQHHWMFTVIGSMPVKQPINSHVFL
uniref:Transcription elongation factor 1 homolog n=1 Tax=Dicentrarchus labrax TaxID=13489 RepID=A0A8P4K0M1_DICLA